VVTLHPATLGADPAVEAACICEVMDRVRATYVVTLPNNDPGGHVIRETLAAASKAPQRIAIEALGARYWSLMASADAMLGNSSSALVEAPAIGLPAVNVGTRQRGRLRGPNVIDVELATVDAVTAALERALDPRFRASISDASRALYGGGGASARVIAILETWTPPRPPVKATLLSR
jgi:UDP-N-acetylglucosamine 2-epimerase